MSALAPEERFIVWAFRRWVVGLRDNESGHWTLVWNEFARQFGAEDGREALAGFAGMVDGLVRYARRTLTHHQPCCPCVGADEFCIVRMVTACTDPDSPRAHALAQWMARGEGVDEIVAAATRLACVVARHKPWLGFGEDAVSSSDIENDPDSGPVYRVH